MASSIRLMRVLALDAGIKQTVRHRCFCLERHEAAAHRPQGPTLPWAVLAFSERTTS